MGMKPAGSINGIPQSIIAALMASGVAVSCGYAQETVTLEKIEVADDYTAMDERRDNSIAKRIIKASELTQYGDLNALEILKRTPGVTIPDGKANRGAPGKGYTVVMVDGEATSASTAHRGSPLEQISPDMIEHIEIMTNGSAEHTAESMGGIVNIVLKKPKSQGETKFKGSGGVYGTSATGSVFGQREGKIDRLNYLLSVNGSDTTRNDSASTLKTGGATETSEERDITVRNRSLSLATKLVYTPSSKTKYLYSGSATFNRTVEESGSTIYPDGSKMPTTQIDKSDRSESLMLWSGVSGEHRLSGDELLEWKLKIHQLTDEGESVSIQSLPTRSERRQSEYGFMRILGAESNYSRFVGDHFIKTGIDLRRSNQRDEIRRSANGADLTFASDNVRMREDRGAVFLQDEINVGESVVVTPGIRYETFSRDFGTVSDIDYFAPSLHLLKRFGQNDTLRASVAKTVRLPRLSQMTTSVVSSLEYNDLYRPDTTGNPNLREEKALSYELRYEHFFEDKGVAGVSGFYRTINDKIENLTRLEGGRYVMRPYNSGRGDLWGMELEFKKSLSAYLEGLGIFANATVQDSSLTNTISGYTRPIKQTSRVLCNIGADHTPKGYGFTYGAAYRYVGGYEDPMDESGVAQTRNGYGTLDLYASKRINQTFKARINLNNMTHAVVETTSRYSDGGGAFVTQVDKERSRPSVLFTLEGKW